MGTKGGFWIRDGCTHHPAPLSNLFIWMDWRNGVKGTDLHWSHLKGKLVPETRVDSNFLFEMKKSASSAHSTLVPTSSEGFDYTGRKRARGCRRNTLSLTLHRYTTSHDGPFQPTRCCQHITQKQKIGKTVFYRNEFDELASKSHLSLRGHQNRWIQVGRRDSGRHALLIATLKSESINTSIRLDDSERVRYDNQLEGIVQSSR